QQVEQRCLAAPVAAGEAELPAGIQLGVGMGKNRVVPPRIGEIEVVDRNQRHQEKPPFKKGCIAESVRCGGRRPGLCGCPKTKRPRAGDNPGTRPSPFWQNPKRQQKRRPDAKGTPCKRHGKQTARGRIPFVTHLAEFLAHPSTSPYSFWGHCSTARGKMQGVIPVRHRAPSSRGSRPAPRGCR